MTKFITKSFVSIILCVLMVVSSFVCVSSVDVNAKSVSKKYIYKTSDYTPQKGDFVFFDAPDTTGAVHVALTKGLAMIA